jgi:hypothetical protein
MISQDWGLSWMRRRCSVTESRHLTSITLSATFVGHFVDLWIEVKPGKRTDKVIDKVADEVK